MKKITTILIVLLIAALTTAGSTNSEKLKHDDNQWDQQWYFTYYPKPVGDKEGYFTLEVNLLLHHGIAKADSHKGKFSLQITAFDHDGNEWDIITPVEHDDQGWDKGDKFIPSTGVLEWNGDDDGGGTITRLSIVLLGPDGKALGPAISADTENLFFYGPEYEEPPGCGDEFPCPGTL